ncbi:jacalin-related lectin 3 isoform X2 [Elaeis guineensis]|uniref:Jacalin-related lectin 3 n=1 Tax=Elaeis guineensis var. tenera TaxID=51953 RepID=A0A8N4F9N5_ELAGV|nr:jacalin-related lectin 3 [Elaeis guineensis]
MSFWNGNEKSPILVGPWGGEGGSPWDDGVYTTIRQVVVVHGAAIDSIQIEYDKKGSSVWSEKHGGNGGTKTDKIKLDHPLESLTSVSGYYGSLSSGSPAIIRSLTFESNQAKYGPFGYEQGMRFSFPMSGGKIVGFHGRSGWYLDSIGFYLKQLRSSNPSKSLVPSQSLTPNWNGKYGYNAVDGTISKGYDIVLAVRDRGDNYTILSNNYTREGSLTQEFRDIELRNKVTYGVIKEPVPIGPGPWGGDGGKPWDDGVYSGIKQVYITRGEVINSIQIEYDRSGQSVWSARHGGSGVTTHRIKFDYPHEVLNCVSGYYATINRDERPTVIKSLSFYTSRGKYGPFGEEVGTHFTSATTEGKVVGFHGRSALYLDAIGVHMQHWLGEKSSATKSLLSKYFF